MTNWWKSGGVWIRSECTVLNALYTHLKAAVAVTKSCIEDENCTLVNWHALTCDSSRTRDVSSLVIFSPALNCIFQNKHNGIQFLLLVTAWFFSSSHLTLFRMHILPHILPSPCLHICMCPFSLCVFLSFFSCSLLARTPPDVFRSETEKKNPLIFICEADVCGWCWSLPKRMIKWVNMLKGEPCDTP